MKQTKICPYCNKTFVTELNSKKYCRQKCTVLASAKRSEKKKDCLCQWCGQVFTAKRKKKFCDSNCQSTYMKKLGKIQKTVIKIPVKITLNDAARQSKEEGITYGRYVSLKRI